MFLLKFHPLTPDRWGDFEALFGERGACAGCWCMWWRLPRSQFAKNTGLQNKRAMRRLVVSGQVPGILAYANGQAIAWCSIGPRETYQALERSRVLKRVDNEPVWSIACFFVAKPYRRKGIMVPMISVAIKYAKENGAKIVEGYPMDPREALFGSAGYTGVVSAFRKARFVEVVRRSRNRCIMRYLIEKR